jgi:hypothetical protein
LKSPNPNPSHEHHAASQGQRPVVALASQLPNTHLRQTKMPVAVREETNGEQPRLLLVGRENGVQEIQHQHKIAAIRIGASKIYLNAKIDCDGVVAFSGKRVVTVRNEQINPLQKQKH